MHAESRYSNSNGNVYRSLAAKIKAGKIARGRQYGEVAVAEKCIVKSNHVREWVMV